MAPKAGFRIAVVLAACGVIGSLVWTLVSFERLDREIAAYPRVELLSSEAVTLEARRHIVYLEGPGVEDNRHPVKIVMRHRRSERRVSAKPYDKTPFAYSNEDTELQALATVTPPVAGVYDVRTEGHDDLIGYNVAFGDSTGPKAGRIIIGAFAIAGIPMLAALIVLVVSGKWRERERGPLFGTGSPNDF